MMNKILGILGLLIFVCLFTTVLNDGFVSQYNLYNITRWSALFGILSVGVAFVIITGGIDLSIGSVVGLVACLLPMLVVRHDISPLWAIIIVLAVAGGIGLLHGLLITRLDLQPFVVTLCGLLFYRGFARWLTDDATLGFGQDYDDSLRLLAIGKPCSWATMLLATGVLLLAWGIWRSLRESRAESGQRELEPGDSDKGDLGESSPAKRPATNGDAVGVPIRAGTGAELTEWISRWSVLLIGGLMILVGSSRFWGGWESGEGAVLFTAGGFQIRGLGIEVDPENAAFPASVMRWAGAAIFFPCLALFSVWAWKGDAKRMRLPSIALVIAHVFLALAVWRLVPPFQNASPNDLWKVGAVTLSGSMLKTMLMIAVFVIVAGVIGAIGWFLSAAGRASAQSRALIPLLVTGGVMVLLGQTNLAATMVPMPMLILIALSVVASIFLNRTVYGRYLLALGRNEEAARYSGINTKRMIVLAYVLCALAAGLGGILFSLDVNSVQPAGFGNFYELYAIAAAVLGGCSLRGGEGNILGVVIGAAVMRVLYNAINILGISTKLEFAIIGLVILAGVIVDVLVKRAVAKRAVLAREQIATE